MSSATSKSRPIGADILIEKARVAAAARIAEANAHGERQAALFEILMQITKPEGES